MIVCMPQPTAVGEPVDRLAVAEVLDQLIVWARRTVPSTMSSISVTTLLSLAETGPQRVTDLATQQAVSQPSMTALVNRLCQEGYATRQPHPHDGRAVLVAITPGGRRELRQRHADRAAAFEAAISRLHPDHQHALAGLAAPLRALTEQTSSTESSHA